MRCVLDTNVLLAGLATHGLCEALVVLSFLDHTVILSEHILNELAEHYASKVGASQQQIELVISTLRDQSEVVEPVRVPQEDFTDPDDLPILGTAVAGKADMIVTGDQDLLGLGEYRGIPILSPRQCYERMRL